MNPIFEAALEVETACLDAVFRFCFIGGLAVQRWGEPRLTQVVDLTLLTGFGGEEPYVEALLARFRGRLIDAATFALEHRVLLLVASNGTPIDVSFGAMPFEERSIERSSCFSIAEGVTLQTCSAEDLVVHKAFAGRDKDWMDIRGIVDRRGPSLDRALIWEEVTPLFELQGGPEGTARLRGLLG